MMEEQQYESQSYGDTVDLFPSKRKTGVLQKTREALGKVNSKLKHNGKTRKGNMLAFESDSSFDYNPEEDLGNNIWNPSKSDFADVLGENTNEDRIEDRPDNQVEEVLASIDISQSAGQLNQGSPASPRPSSQKKFARATTRNARSHIPSSSQPSRSNSSGDVIQRSKHKSLTAASSARLKRHQSVPVPVVLPNSRQSASPSLRRKCLVTQTHAVKEQVAQEDMPESPALNSETDLEDLFDTPGQEDTSAETSWKRVSRAFEDGNGAMGGYFAKLLEKMEGGISPEDQDNGELQKDGDEEEQKKSAKFKTPKRIRKFFSLARSPRSTISSKENEIAEEEVVVSDMAVFTAFISSPKKVDSPRRSEGKHISQPTDDGSDSKSDEFQEIPAAKQSSLDDIRKEVNLRREGYCGTAAKPEPPATPKTVQSLGSIRRSSVEHGGKTFSERRRSKVDIVSKDPESPGKWNSTHRRGGKRDGLENSSNVVNESIPLHSMSNRRTRTTRPPESRSHVNEQLSKSTHRHRRARGSSSRESLEHPGMPDTQLKLEKDNASGNDSKPGAIEKPGLRHFGESFDAIAKDSTGSSAQHCQESERTNTAPEKGHSGSRKKRISNGRIDTRGLIASSSQGKRKTAPGTRRPERPSSERSCTDPLQTINGSKSSRDATSEGPATQHFGSSSKNVDTNQSFLAESLGSEPLSPSISRRPRQRQALLLRASSLSNVHKDTFNTGDLKSPSSRRLKRQSSESKLSSVTETDERCSGIPNEDNFDVDRGSQVFHGNETSKKKSPSLTESLERGSELNIRLFDEDGQETVVTDDGSLWLDQCSITGLNIKSSASVVAPQLVFDQNMSRIVEKA